MKAIIAKMGVLRNELQEVVDKRTKAFDNRTKEWKESEKGEEHNELTDWLCRMADDIAYWAEGLKKEM